MPSKRKGFQGAQKKKGQTKHAAQAFAKAASDAAVANGLPNPTPVGRPRAGSRPSPGTQKAGAATASEKKKMLEALRQMNVDPTFAGLLLVWTMTTQRRLRSSCNKDE